jgi:hypothetical protein
MHLEIHPLCFQRKDDARGKIIALLVIILHGVLLSFVIYNSPYKPVKIQNKKLVVNTISLKSNLATYEVMAENRQENTPQPLLEVQKAELMTKDVADVHFKNEIKAETPIKPIKKANIREPEKKPQVVKKPENVKIDKKPPVIKKLEGPKVEPKKKVEEKNNNIENPKKVLKAEVNKNIETTKIDEKALQGRIKQKELLIKAQENLKKIDKGAVATLKQDSLKNASLVTVERLGALSVDSLNESCSVNILESSYKDEIASRLKAMLKLPELGEVKIKLTLKSSGAFKKLAIISADSDKNRKYIEKEIKNLTYPSFSGMFKKVDEYTFSITLK